MEMKPHLLVAALLALPLAAQTNTNFSIPIGNSTRRLGWRTDGVIPAARQDKDGLWMIPVFCGEKMGLAIIGLVALDMRYDQAKQVEAITGLRAKHSALGTFREGRGWSWLFYELQREDRFRYSVRGLCGSVLLSMDFGVDLKVAGMRAKMEAEKIFVEFMDRVVVVGPQ